MLTRELAWKFRLSRGDIHMMRAAARYFAIASLLALGGCPPAPDPGPPQPHQNDSVPVPPPPPPHQN
jgi:hypothetical protein